jgi:general secretion pathway protein G
VGKSIEKAREASLKEDLYVVRKAIDDFYADNHRYPESLDLLVQRHYLKTIPHDPVSEQPWKIIHDESGTGVKEIRSSSPGVARDGRPFHEW